MLLYGKELAQQWQTELQSQRLEYFGEQEIYLAIIFLGENPASKIYVQKKQLYGQAIQLPVLVFGQGIVFQGTEKDNLQTQRWQEKSYLDKDAVLELIDFLNQDPHCVGIILQLPLPQNLQSAQTELLSAISPEKDLDGMNGVLLGKSFLGEIDFTPATPKAVLKLLDHYELGDLKGKNVVILGKGIVVGKPLALEVLKRGGFLKHFDIHTDTETIKQHCQQADYIFSATGSNHLIDASYLNEQKNQILIDIGYGYLNGKPVGDVQREQVQDKVLHLSPVPGGIGPLTVAALFENIFDLYRQKHLLSEERREKKKDKTKGKE